MFKFACTREFLEEFRVGQRAALERVYWAYVGEVESVVRRLLHARRLGSGAGATLDAGDAVQEIFLRAFSDKARNAFDAEREYGPYLATLARNLTIDALRRHGREVPLGDPEEFETPAETDVEDAWAERQMMELVNRYIAELPEGLRAVHEQRFVLCRTQEEVGATLGISRQQLRSREQRLRDGLARHLADAEHTEARAGERRAWQFPGVSRAKLRQAK